MEISPFPRPNLAVVNDLCASLISCFNSNRHTWKQLQSSRETLSIKRIGVLYKKFNYSFKLPGCKLHFYTHIQRVKWSKNETPAGDTRDAFPVWHYILPIIFLFSLWLHLRSTQMPFEGFISGSHLIVIVFLPLSWCPHFEALAFSLTQG